MATIFWKVGCRQMAATSKAFEIFWAWINSKAVDAVSIWRGMESIGFRLEKLKSRVIPIFALNTFE